MRPLKLSMCAFGPYVGEVSIDFAAELTSGIFLIYGATGAGKTTILDAICFALYGEGSGLDRKAKMFRAVAAKDTTDTWAEFTFALGERVYRVRRSPEYTRESKRGNGEQVTKKAAAALYRVDGDEEKQLAARPLETTEKIENFLGFRCEEFRQVVMLPQGEFKKLLMADSKSRREIMNVLFRTEFYRSLTMRLKEYAKELAAENARLEERCNILLRQTETADANALAALVEEKKAQLKIQAENAKNLEKLHRDAQDNLLKGRQIGDLFRELNAAKKLVEDDEKKSADVKKYRELLTAADKAARFFDRENTIDALKRELTEQQLALRELNRATAQIAEKFAAAQKKNNDEQKKLPLQKEKEARLQDLLRYQKNAAALNDARENLKAAERVYKESLFQQEKLETKFQSQISVLQEKLTEQQEKTANLRQTALMGKAAALAQKLKPNEPCPVCGSIHHPKPAASDSYVPTDEEVEQEEETLRLLNRQLNDSREKAAEAINAAKAKCDETAANYRELKGIYGETEKQIPAEYRDFAALQREINKLTGEIQNMQKSRDDAATKWQKISEEKSVHAEKTNMAQKAKEKTEAAATAAQISFDADIKNAGFADFAEYQRAAQGKWRDLSRREEVRERIRAFEDKKIIHLDAFNKAAAKTEGKSPPDENSLKKFADEAEEKWRNQVAAVERNRKDIETLTKIFAELKNLQKDVAALAEKCGAAKILADAAAGGEGRMSFEAYILRSILKDVTEAANARLSKMSRNRYRLSVSDTAANRRKEAGLDIDIIDEYSGARRPCATLSGGEGFLASLSLALGLSDVVTRMAGGIHLDTVFIDEGFGTLDAETLDMAMNTITELQSDGRLVGIISHVEELKRRIPLRLAVTRNLNSSSVRFEN